MTRKSDNQPLTKLSMIHWYQPLLLLRIGARALLATVIGQIADNRELQATDSRDQSNRWDYRGANNGDNGNTEEAFWVDFVADTGDGWQTSYAVAHALARDHLRLEGDVLPRADLLLLGGDLVYPDPSLDDYQARTLAPYNHACADQPHFNADVFAVPGNHDWYDGLHAFQDIFCHDKEPASQWPFGHWKKPQSHSYFSLQLPAGWWVLAPDVQLDNRINPAQRRYFREVVSQMQPGDRVIAVAPYPHWSLKEPNEYGGVLEWLSELSQSAGAQLMLVLTGDLHHYARYTNGVNTQSALQLITAGGGGAFLHPTHTLPDQTTLRGLRQKANTNDVSEEVFTQQAVYPSTSKSHALSFKNAFFPILNWQLSLFVGFVYTMLAWVLETRQLVGTESVSELFKSVLIEHGGVGEALNHVITMVPKSPEFALVVLLTALGLTAFNENCTRGKRIFLGALHTLFHLIGFVLTLCIAVTVTGWIYSYIGALSFSFFWFLLVMIGLGGGAGGLVIGLYLMLSLNLFGANMTNAFSSLRLREYKNFVRMKIDANGDLTIYPLGIDTPAAEASVVTPIEAPIVIR